MSIHGVRANELIVDERALTKRVTSNDVKQTLETFQINETGVDVMLVVSTTTDLEARAKDILDLGEAALNRLFGSETKTEVSVITSQREETAKLHVTARALAAFAANAGVSRLEAQELGDFLAARVSAEYQLLMLRFKDTDLLEKPNLELELPGRSFTVQRKQVYR